MSEQDTGGSENQTQATEQSGGSANQTVQPNLGAIRKDGQREVINALAKELGVNFDSKKDIVKFVKDLQGSQSNKSGDSAQSSKVTNSGKSNSEIAELRQMVQSLQTTIQEKDRAVRTTSLQSQIKDVAMKTGFDPSMLDISTGLFEQQLAYDEDGSYYVKGKDGGIRLDHNGEPFTLDKLAQEILRNRPKLAVEVSRTGTGTKYANLNYQNGVDFNGVPPDAIQNPEGWKAWKEANGLGNKGKAQIGVSISQRKY